MQRGFDDWRRQRPVGLFFDFFDDSASRRSQTCNPVRSPVRIRLQALKTCDQSRCHQGLFFEVRSQQSAIASNVSFARAMRPELSAQGRVQRG